MTLFQKKWFNSDFKIIHIGSTMRIILLLLILILSLSYPTFAQGDLLVTPTRVVFEGNKQREELNLVNMGKDTTTYSVSFVQYNQNEDGSYVIIEKPDSGQMFADPYLRIFPRQVTLAPGEPQVIILQCRRKTDMLAGEYRSHLYFRSEKDYKPLGTKRIDTTLISVQLIPVFGISIPIIIRSGDVNVSTAISDLKLGIQQDTIQTLQLIINRTGNISAYGNLIAEYFPLKGKSYQIGKVKGVKVFTNINKLNVSIKLNTSPGLKLKNGKLKVSYTSPDNSKYVVYAEKELELGK